MNIYPIIVSGDQSSKCNMASKMVTQVFKPKNTINYLPLLYIFSVCVCFFCFVFFCVFFFSVHKHDIQ